MGAKVSTIELESVSEPPMETAPDSSSPIPTKIGVHEEYLCATAPRFLKVKLESAMSDGLIVIDGFSRRKLFSAYVSIFFELPQERERNPHLGWGTERSSSSMIFLTTKARSFTSWTD
ncbi:hypothetical protein IE53DRAFT_209273 [Violaceomyces palustris]|uniref:Uncharacterized protein n=1 Tax=Violaceomyces palustris TaxID=1673888 RepID=A0ACD0NQS5_9BASI|nr:hypothetical protein IE53DRAFT_209273 [Violaceomyces palustris]